MTEKTVKSYKEPGKRIQLVRLSEDCIIWYEVRFNRRIISSTYRFDHAITKFKTEVFKYINQLELL